MEKEKTHLLLARYAKRLPLLHPSSWSIATRTLPPQLRASCTEEQFTFEMEARKVIITNRRKGEKEEEREKKRLHSAYDFVALSLWSEEKFAKL